MARALPLLLLSFLAFHAKASDETNAAALPIRLQAFAREQVPVTNPIRWVQFVDQVPDGTRVQKGDILFRLDLSGPEDRKIQAEEDLKKIRNRTARELGELEDKLLDLEDRITRRSADLEVVQARIRELNALPNQDDVAIAQGRLDVAARNLQAAKEDLERAEQRFAEELISPGDLARSKLDHETQKARYDYARRRLGSTDLPAHPLQLSIEDLKAENLKLEVEKLSRERDTQEELFRLKERSRERELESKLEELREAEEELKHGEVPAPQDGVILYTSQLKRHLAQGHKPPKDMTLVEFPLQESLALRGSIAEHLRPLMKVGGECRIRINSFPGESFTGRLLEISPYSRDALAGDNNSEDSGVKWVDVVFEIDAAGKEIPFGSIGWAEWLPEKPSQAHVFPIDWVRVRAGKPHLSVQGTYQPVEGWMAGAEFWLLSPELDKEQVFAEGTWPRDPQQHTGPIEEEDERRFRASGELQPVSSIAIEAPHVRTWDMKITWVAPENEFMKQGDPLIRLESDRLRDRLKSAKREANKSSEELEQAREELSLRVREESFRVKVEENKTRIKEMELELVENSVSSSQLHQAILNLQTQGLQKAEAERNLARMDAKPDLFSRLERTRAERRLTRLELDLEKTRNNFEDIRKGESEEAKSQARLELLRQKATLAEVTASTRKSRSGAESRVRWRTRRLRRHEKELRRAENDIKALTLKAPEDGILQHQRIWDGVGRSKLRSGMTVYRGFHLLSLSNDHNLKVEVDVPERYLPLLKEGMELEVRIPSEGNLTRKASIASISPLLHPAQLDSVQESLYSNREPPSEQVAKVNIHLESAQDSISPGAIAHVLFPFAP